MNKLLLSILGVLSFISLKAQFQTYIPFPEDSAQWSMVYEFTYNGKFESYMQHYKLRGDTLVGGFTYGKVYRSRVESYDPGNYDTLHLLLRQDTILRHVYVKYLDLNTYPDTTDFLLYDFSRKKGEKTLLRYLTGNYKPQNAILIKDSVSVLDTSSTIYTSGEQAFLLHKHVTSEIYSCADVPVYPFANITYVEGVGTEVSPFINEYFYCERNSTSNGIKRELQCFKSKGKRLMGASNNCHVNYQGNFNSFEEVKSSRFVFETLISEKLTINNKSNNPIFHVSICDINGKKVIERTENGIIASYDKEYIGNSGIYFLVISQNNTIIQVSKILIH